MPAYISRTIYQEDILSCWVQIMQAGKEGTCHACCCLQLSSHENCGHSCLYSLMCRTFMQSEGSSLQKATSYTPSPLKCNIQTTHVGTLHINCRKSAHIPCRAAAKKALLAYKGFMQLGGGVTPENAAEWLDAGASHVIVTSYIFHNGELNEDRLKALVSPLCCWWMLRSHPVAVSPLLACCGVLQGLSRQRSIEQRKR